jgi:4,5-dihydroxyphthalate decarboxylase
MSTLTVTLVIKDYDHLAPLAAGDVVAEDLDLRLDRDTPGALDRTLDDPSVQVGELSFARHLARLSQDDHEFVGIPIFPTRAFRQRCFFVRRDSNLRDLKDLAGKRIGTNEWPATGNTWSRALLREQGVDIEGISWVVGSVDGGYSARSQGDLPPHVRENSSDRPLRDLLVAGELDALMCPTPPKGFYDADSPIVRLIPDYRRAEQEYCRRTGIYPAHHIVGIRRELFEREPWVARSIYLALDESKNRWQASRRRLADTSPWLLADLEDVTSMLGADFQPSGVEPNRKMVQALCDELDATGLLAKPLAEASVFADFEKVMKD